MDAAVLIYLPILQVLFFLVYLVYSVIAPMVTFVVAFSFVALGSMVSAFHKYQIVPS